jgi:glycosyltransferase involved in cell wall biosynthesis
MEIVWVSPFHLFPAIHGGRIRLLNLLKAVVGDGHLVELWVIGDAAPDNSLMQDVEVVRFDSRRKKSLPDKARALLSPLPVWAWQSTRTDVEARLKQRLEAGVDAVVLEELHTAAYLLSVSRGIPVIVDLLNVEARVMSDLSSSSVGYPRLRLWLDAKKMRRLERLVIGRATEILAVSVSDANYFRSAGAKSVTVVANGVDSRWFGEVRHEGPTRQLAMTANFGYAPNDSGARWLIREVLPLIWKQDPTVRVAFVGSGPQEWLQRAAKEDARLVVTGEVPDVRPYLAESAVAVVPLLVGGGTSLKVAEALAAGLPIVSTEIGARGYPLVENGLGRVVNTADQFAEAVIGALATRGDSEAAQKRRDFAAETLDWSQTLAPLLGRLRYISGCQRDD